MASTSSDGDDHVYNLSELLVNPSFAAQIGKQRPAGEPLALNFSVIVQNVQDIDSIKGAMGVQAQLHVWWTDPRLALPAGVDRVQIYDVDSVWKPMVDMYNVVEEVHYIADKLALVRHGSGSKLVFSRRFTGEFTVRMDFTFFPFDRVVFPLVLEVVGNP